MHETVYELPRECTGCKFYLVCMRQSTSPERAQNKIGTLYAYYRVLEVPSMHETENYPRESTGCNWYLACILMGTNVPGMHETENYPRESTGCNWYEGSQ